MGEKKELGNRAEGLSRRSLMKRSVAGIGAAIVGSGKYSDASNFEGTSQDLGRDLDIGPASPQPFAALPMDVVRIGFVGVGGMGSAHCRNLLRIEGVELKVICDTVREKVERIQRWTVEAGQPKPTGYWRDEYDFIRMCEKEELDLVYTATPWKWHVPVCVAAMENGKHAATEVPAAVTIDECWQLVEKAEQHQKHCIMIENVCYGRMEMLVLNMVRQGILGEILHGECGYLHDLRELKFSDEGEGLWRREHSILRNGNLYPTHGLGPIANCMNINRGDQFEYLVSMSGNSRGLGLYAQRNFSPSFPQRNEKYALGDVNVSLIHTVEGRTIFLSHDTNLPRPYSRIPLVQGTRGIFQGYPDRVYIEGRSQGHRWDPAEQHAGEFEHPLWAKKGEDVRGAGHGGMDYLEDYRLVKCLREGVPTDMNVYDAAALSAVSELSETSVANRSQPVDLPDFTRGRWRSYPPLGIVEA